MSEDMHEATFSWPEVDAETVIVTGTFDNWSSSVHLTKTPRGFEGKVKLPWGDRVLYKFVVDGKWVTAQSQPEEPDNSGNLNNVYECPSKPGPSADSVSLHSEVDETSHDKVESVSTPVVVQSSSTAQGSVDEKAPQSTPKTDGSATPANNVLSGGIGSASNQPHPAVVVPVLETVQNIVHDPTSTLIQAKDTVPSVVTETAQKLLDTAKMTAEQTQAVAASLVTPVVDVLQDAAHAKAPEQAKEADTPSEVVKSKGSDPLNPDKIPVATPTPTHDGFDITTQDPPVEHTAPTTSQSLVDLGQDVSVSVPVVNEVLPPAPVPAETVELAPEITAIEPDATIVQAPAVQDMSAVPSEPEAVEPTRNVATEPLEEAQVEKVAPVAEPTPAVEEAPGVEELPKPVPIPPPIFDSTTEQSGPDVPKTETALPETNRDQETIPVVAESTPPTTNQDTTKAASVETPEPVTMTDGKPEPEVVPQPEAATQLEVQSQAEVRPQPETKPQIEMTPQESRSAAKSAEENVSSTTEAEAESRPEVTPQPEVESRSESKPSEAIVSSTTEPEPVPAAAEPQPTVPSPDTTALATPATNVLASEAVVSPAADADKAVTSTPEKAANGHSTDAASTPAKEPQTESEPTGTQAFPTTSSATSSPATSKFGSTRKKRTSIFGKVKNLFSSDKDDRKEKKEKK